MRVRVVVAEPDPLLCEGLAASLNETPELAAWPAPGSLSGALERCVAEPSAVLLVNESLLEGTDGRRFAQLVEYGRAIPVLVLGPAAHPENVLRFLRLGCMGYVHRGESLATLRRAIAAVAGGQIWARRTILTQLLREMIDVRTRGPQLTAREREVLGLIHGGASNAEIAASLFISPETVRWHVRRLFAKIGAQDRASAIELARQHVFPLPEPLPAERARSAAGANGTVHARTAGIGNRL